MTPTAPPAAKYEEEHALLAMQPAYRPLPQVPPLMRCGTGGAEPALAPATEVHSKTSEEDPVHAELSAQKAPPFESPHISPACETGTRTHMPTESSHESSSAESQNALEEQLWPTVASGRHVLEAVHCSSQTQLSCVTHGPPELLLEGATPAVQVPTEGSEADRWQNAEMH
jgi:hypothetical protein